ncbi:MAG TPA: SDR family oxidoreductase [Salinimicrobium sp.]|nr:SDR family oxidoreductase [Salinimicrobium sp.]
MKNIIITGTSRGIGLELVKQFSEMDHNVLALSRNTQPVETLGLKNVKSIGFDITDENSFSEVKKIVGNSFSNIDILINNAGAIVNKPFSETTTSDFKKVFETNVFGVAELCRTLIPFMGNDCHVVNISSMGGVRGSAKFPGLAAYSSSKGALITLTELLAEEYKETGPAFNVVALGAVQTEMLQEAFPGYQAPLSAAEMATYIVDFALTGNKYYNGKVLEVSKSTP